MTLMEGSISMREKSVRSIQKMNFRATPPGWRFPWKLHRFVDKGEETLELYNLKSDSQETTNLHSQEPSRIERMLNHLEDWQIAVMRSLNGKDY